MCGNPKRISCVGRKERGGGEIQRELYRDSNLETGKLERVKQRGKDAPKRQKIKAGGVKMIESGGKISFPCKRDGGREDSSGSVPSIRVARIGRIPLNST